MSTAAIIFLVSLAIAIIAFGSLVYNSLYTRNGTAEIVQLSAFATVAGIVVSVIAAIVLIIT